MRSVVSFLAICAVVVVAALWAKYDSLDPCAWILPSVAAEAGLRQDEMARLVNDRRGGASDDYGAWELRLHRQSTGECLVDWANLRLHGLDALKDFDELPVQSAKGNAAPGEAPQRARPQRHAPPQISDDAPVGGTDPARGDGYTPAERNAMQRLIDRKQ